MSLELESPRPVQPGRVITFYSYKGGVGRSMALANLAVLLSHKGFRVLMVDFDLEAPGLHRYFDQWLPSVKQRTGKGILPLLKSIAEGANPNTDGHVLRIDLEKNQFLGNNFQPLYLLPSGLGSPNYAKDLQDFSWSDFIANHDGASVVDKWRSEWIDPDPTTGSPKYDLVLVDSRTGLTDHGSVCTILLPDVLTLCFTANEQNLQGIKAVAQSAQTARTNLPDRRPQLTLLPLLTRFDGNDEFDEGQSWLTKISKELAFCYANWLPKTIEPRRMLVLTKLPYVSKFSFGEPLPVLLQGVDDPASIGHALLVTAGLLGSNFRSIKELEPENSDSLLKIPSRRREIAAPETETSPSYCPNCRESLPAPIESWICLRPQLHAKASGAAMTLGGGEFSADEDRGCIEYQQEDDICGAFNVGGSVCAKCQQAREKNYSIDACPSCHNELPFSNNLASSCITITGPSGAGKTSYMLAINDWWVKNLFSFGLMVHSAMSQTRERDFHHLRDHLFGKRLLLNATPSGGMISFSWTLTPIQSDQPGLLFTVTDVSGESLTSQRRLIANRYYQNTAGIIFLIDAARMLPEGDHRPLGDHADVAHAMINDFLRRSATSEWRSIPIAICVNKIDLLREFSQEWACITDEFRPNNDGVFDYHVANKRSIRVRDLLCRDSETASAVNLIESQFHNLMYFPIATLGSNELRKAPIKPISVEDPFLFLLWHLGYVGV